MPNILHSLCFVLQVPNKMVRTFTRNGLIILLCTATAGTSCDVSLHEIYHLEHKFLPSSLECLSIVTIYVVTDLGVRKSELAMWLSLDWRHLSFIRLRTAGVSTYNKQSPRLIPNSPSSHSGFSQTASSWHATRWTPSDDQTTHKENSSLSVDIEHGSRKKNTQNPNPRSKTYWNTGVAHRSGSCHSRRQQNWPALVPTIHFQVIVAR